MILYEPSPETVRRSQASAFMRFCEVETDRWFRDEAEFDAFSVAEFRRFWSLFLRWSALHCEGALEPVCEGDAVESARFFPNVRLSYVENLLWCDPSNPRDADRPAVIACHAGAPTEYLSRGELRDRVYRVAGAFAALGLHAGERVVAIARNNAATIVAALAAAELGATFSSAASEMGAATILSRFEQLQPALLVANLQSSGTAEAGALASHIGDVVQALPTLRAIVAIDNGPAPPDVDLPLYRFDDLLESTPLGTERAPARHPFDHPLFVLFSSGTTGAPKCIVHGAGGTLLEHVKEHRLHLDLRPSDRLFFHTSVAWMMWNWQLSALASGASIVCYDGPIVGADTLWRIVADEGVTVFGTSPPYLQLCEDVGYSPRTSSDLSALRAVLSTGSILHDHQYDWVHAAVGALPLQSISGGTDIVGCFVLGHPNLPVRRGEVQCRSLGLDVRALPTRDTPSIANVGELVCANPFPSRPLGFLGDNGTRFHDAYFAENEGVWTHGDLVEIDDAGRVRMHGRSDGVLNVGGARIGPAEIYRVLAGIPEIREAMAVEQQVASASERSRIVLFLVLHEPGSLDDELRGRVRRELARQASPAHVPKLVVEVDELPCTHSGKRSERAARDALNGTRAPNAEALANPWAIGALCDAVANAEPVATPAAGTTTADALRTLWEAVIGVAPIGLDENFFDVGGTSLAAVRLLTALHDRLDVDLPLSTFVQAPTIRMMAAVIDGDACDLPLTVPLRAGTGARPLFLVHGLVGDVFEVRALVERLHIDDPVFGVRARGLDGRVEPHTSVDGMAREYIRQIRAIQPHGPYALGGYSFGGIVAFEMARLLAAAGETVERLVLIDTYLHPACLTSTQRAIFEWRRATALVAGGLRDPRAKLPPFLRRTALRTAPWLPIAPPANDRVALPPIFEQMERINTTAYEDFRLQPYDGSALFVEALEHDPHQCRAFPIWQQAITRVTRSRVAGGHFDMLSEPHVDAVASALDAYLG